jgi:hypothetical protein
MHEPADVIWSALDVAGYGRFWHNQNNLVQWQNNQNLAIGVFNRRSSLRPPF